MKIKVSYLKNGKSKKKEIPFQELEALYREADFASVVVIPGPKDIQRSEPFWTRFRNAQTQPRLK